jgi:PleD family two-component response regulator
VLPDTALANAVKIVEETRMLFSKIHHRTRDRAFKVTFSCGVARQQAGETSHRSVRIGARRAEAGLVVRGRPPGDGGGVAASTVSAG